MAIDTDRAEPALPAPDRLSGRREALRRALYSGNARYAAWAASRARIRSLALDPTEARIARDARLALGRALRRARDGSRLYPLVLPSGPLSLRSAPRSTLRRRLMLGVAAVVAALATALLPSVTVAPDSEPAAGGAAPLPVTANVSRGRTAASVAPAAIVGTRTAAPSLTPLPRLPFGPVQPAQPTGLGGGRDQEGLTLVPGGGGIGGLAGPLPAGTTRVSGRVLDALTRRPVPGVCISIGALACGPASPYTDANGRWMVELARQMDWDVTFEKSGFVPPQISFRTAGLAYDAGDTLIRDR